MFIGRSTFRTFHSSPILFSRWTAAEDALLLKKYEELGPAWTVLSLCIKSRSPIECRRRWLIVSGSLEGLNEEEYKKVYEDGYDKVGNQFIQFPMEQIAPSPFAKMAAAVQPVGLRSQRKRGGWSLLERLAVREGFEQYGPNWKLIASKLQYRTPIQCRNMMIKHYALYNTGLLRTLMREHSEKFSVDITTGDKLGPTDDKLESTDNHQ